MSVEERVRRQLVEHDHYGGRRGPHIGGDSLLGSGKREARGIGLEQKEPEKENRCWSEDRHDEAGRRSSDIERG